MITLTLRFLVVLILFVSWAKAGLAGKWLLFLIDGVVLLSLFALLKDRFTNKTTLFCFVPIILLSVQYLVSIFNPSFTSLGKEELTNINVNNYILSEQNLDKAIMVSEGIESIVFTSKSDPALANSLFFDLKNRYYDKFPESTSASAQLLEKYQSQISLNSNGLIPNAAINNDFWVFIHFICHIIIGLVFYLLVSSKQFIRTICKIIVFNAVLLSVFGILQKIYYVPSDNLLEIWGIWDTPEPRYYFASFTYKNHWSAFALIIISILIGLLQNAFQKKGLHGLHTKTNLFLMTGLIPICTSIPLSGSRSGSLLLILLLIGSLILMIRHYKFYKVKPLLLSILGISIFIFICFLSARSANKETINEMESNFKSQYNNFLSGKFPLRILLWKDLIFQISEKPVFGHGFDSYRAINPIYQSKEVRNERNIVLHSAHSKFVPLISFGHNDWLQRISEFGFFGFCLLAPLLYRLFLAFKTTHSLFQQNLIWGLAVFLIYSFVDFPSHTPICLIMFSVITGLSLKYNLLSSKYHKITNIG